MPTPQRLPIVNSDDGTWGDILRQYIKKEHYDDGTDNAVNGGHQFITIRAGVATAGGAPIKFTSGTLLTAPETGALEFVGDHLYITDTSGPTRRKIPAYDDTGSAEGDIYYRNSTGYFTRLARGNSGDFLTTSGNIPAWTSTIGNTSTITVKDANFTVQNSTTTSKQLKFDLSGLTAGHTTTLAVPEVNGTTTIVGTDIVQTLTNKEITPRVSTTSSSGAISVNCDNYDTYKVTLTGDGTISITGTPTDRQELTLVIKDSGSSHNITWGAAIIPSGTTGLPNVTPPGSKRMTLKFFYDLDVTSWVLLAADVYGY